MKLMADEILQHTRIPQFRNPQSEIPGGPPCPYEALVDATNRKS